MAKSKIVADFAKANGLDIIDLAVTEPTALMYDQLLHLFPPKVRDGLIAKAIKDERLPEVEDFESAVRWLFATANLRVESLGG